MSAETQPSLRGCRVLVVDDEPLFLRAACRILQTVECECDVAESVEQAVARLAAAHYDIALVDVGLGKRSGEEVLIRALSLAEPPRVFMMSAGASVESAVRAMRLGATDFFEKPIHEASLIARFSIVMEAARARRGLAALTAREAAIVVEATPQSAAMAQALALAERVAGTPSSSALLLGESGVGKEVLASYIHRKSQREAQPFVRINVAAIPESMIEAELFGSVKGAFTDSKQSRVGHLASADRGTILLDEIGELRVEYQPKLLRVLEERRFFPMGSDRERVVDVRFLAATNREPEDMISKGILRRDLFYRLGVVIRIPPLRERRDEIVPLARHFIAHFCAEFARPLMALAPAAEPILQRHRWVGNIRELRNVIERAVMTTPGDEIGPDALDIVTSGAGSSMSPEVRRRSSMNALQAISIPPPGTVAASGLPAAARAAAEQVERQRILEVLKVVGGSRSRAAVTLGVSRSTLYEKLKRYAIE